jgi:hypothetical protein
VAGLLGIILQVSSRDGFSMILVKVAGAYNSLVIILDEIKRLSLAADITLRPSA